MLNDLVVISSVAKHNPQLLFWACVLNKKVVLPLYAHEFELWLSSQEQYGHVDIKALRKWVLPLDEFSPLAREDDSVIDRSTFLGAYRKLPRTNVFMDHDLAYYHLTATIKIVAEESAAVCVEGGEFDLIGQFVTIDDTSAHIFGAQNTMSLLIPDIPPLTFNHIEAIRNSSFVDRYADYINKTVATGRTDETELRKLISKNFFGLLSDVQPSTTLTTIKGIVSNTPLPILVNPAGIALAAQDVRKAIKLKRDYGWLFFLSDVHRIISEGGPTDLTQPDR